MYYSTIKNSNTLTCDAEGDEERKANTLSAFKYIKKCEEDAKR